MKNPSVPSKFLLAILAGTAMAASSLIAAETKTGGAYYLTESVSVTTDSGIFSAKPGTKVTRIGGTKVKMDDGTIFDVTEKQITDDPSKAGELTQQEAAKQSAIAAQAHAGAAEEASKQRQRDQAAIAASREAAAQQAPAPVQTAPSTGFTSQGSALDYTGTGTAKVNPAKKKNNKNNNNKKKK